MSTTVTPLHTPANELELFLRTHGLSPGDACHECGKAMDELSFGGCLHCDAPLQELCDHKHCVEVVLPIRDRSQSWTDPLSLCPRHEIEIAGEHQRAAALRWFPPYLQRKLAEGFVFLEHRRQLDVALERWLVTMRDDRYGRNSLYVYGAVGVGKTFATSWALYRALASKALDIGSALYVGEWDLVEAAKARFSDAVGTESRDLLSNARTAEVLLLDDLFSRGKGMYSPKSAETVGEILSHRFERGLATLITSNNPPMWLDVFDARVESRWSECGRMVRCDGRDMRKTGVPR